MRILSTNLWLGRADPDALVSLIRRYEIDLLGAQEMGAEQAEAISAELPYGELQPRADAKGIGIATRLPARFERHPMAFRDLLVARLEPDAWPGLGAPVEFATTHIAAPHVQPIGAGPWHRFFQVRQLERYLVGRPAARRVLVGDFNATPLWPVYRRIAAHLTDAAVAVAQVRGTRVAPTWGPSSDAPRLLRIDHAFVRGLRPESFEVVPMPGSDHSAIVIEVSSSAPEPERTPDPQLPAPTAQPASGGVASAAAGAEAGPPAMRAAGASAPARMARP